MYTTILLCTIIITLIETRYRMKLGMRHAGNRSANLIGGASGKGSDIDQHYGTDRIMPRLLFITLLSLLLYFTWGLGPSLKETRRMVRGDSSVPEKNEERHLAPEPKTELDKPYLDLEPEDRLTVQQAREQDDFVRLVATDAVQTENSYDVYNERWEAAATNDQFTPDGRVPDLEAFRKHPPIGRGNYWLKTTTDDERRVIALREQYRDQVDEVKHEWLPERAYYRVYWGPFRDEAEARAFRDRTTNCNCEIVPR